MYRSQNHQRIVSSPQARLYFLSIAINIAISIYPMAAATPYTNTALSNFLGSKAHSTPRNRIIPTNPITVLIPQGFQTIINDNGVAVYKKDYANKKSEYVTVVNTTKASINNLLGEVINTPNGTIGKKVLTEFWQDAINKNTSSKTARVVINGTFFSTNDNPTGIAFGLKVASHVITYGYAIGKEYPGLIRVFNGRMQSGFSISPYARSIFDDKSNLDAVGALDVTADKSATRYLPRTFVGVKRDTRSVKPEAYRTVIFYSSNYARQIDATNTLKAFGASDMAMLDGGGSTGIIIDGKPVIATNREIPHAN